MPGTVTMPLAISPLAGKPAPKEMLVDVAHLERKYYERRPDYARPRIMNLRVHRLRVGIIGRRKVDRKFISRNL